MISRSESASWIAYRKPRPAPRVRLFCFPYAGGGASIYRSWSDALPEPIEVCPVQLPGREARIREPPFTRTAPLIEAMTAALGDELAALPTAFFGHSMGALLGFELARALRRGGRPGPRFLFASARRAPHMPSRDRPIHDLPGDEFRAELRRLDGTPEEVLAHPELMDLLEPLLRADFELIDTHEHVPGEPLGCPITAFGGIQDPSVTAEEVAGWAEHTAGTFRRLMFPGDHFFLHHEARQDLCRQLARDLQPLL